MHTFRQVAYTLSIALEKHHSGGQQCRPQIILNFLSGKTQQKIIKQLQDGLWLSHVSV